MSVFRWRYDENCEGRYCCGDCDKCDKEDEPVDDLIRRQAAIDAINSGMLTDDDTQFECPSECNSMLEWAANAVKELPTAEKKGKWIDYCGGVKCDQCGFECDDTYYLGEANFCPNCGARMEN